MVSIGLFGFLSDWAIVRLEYWVLRWRRLQPMQQLLPEVWQQLKTTVLFVTHDIDEAILLADRVCVMTARPGRITRDIPITLRRPRSIDDLTSADFTRFKALIMAEMRGAHSPH
jgi:NitT/TauT family transport system ATP-binding protein